MIKVFTTNKNGKIELTPDELKTILDEAYWEGYRSNSHIYTYSTPSWPFNITCDTANSQTITLANVDAGDLNCGRGGVKNCHDNAGQA